MIRPLATQLEPVPDPLDALGRLQRLPHCVFLDSSLRHADLGRYSFLAADPYDRIVCRSSEVAGRGASVLNEIRSRLAVDNFEGVKTGAPFQGGAVGLVGYEFNHALENLPSASCDEFGIPALALGIYDVVLAWDHVAETAYVYSTGMPETEPDRRRRRAVSRRDEFLRRLQGPVDDRREMPLADSPLAIATSIVPTERSDVFSNFSKADYCGMVREAVEKIRNGDCFQVNLSQRLLIRQRESPMAIYRRLRGSSPAPFSAYGDFGHFQIASISPERFLRVSEGTVEARPVKGTRREHSHPTADLYSRYDLSASAKDVAENTMIVDLIRNDLSRVCTDDSVEVVKLCGLESYGYVHHLVSVITSTLRSDTDCLDLIGAAFPCGSVTGAPKVQAMRIITELEGVARGAYCGSLGYLGFDGNMDLNVLIRTMTVSNGWCQIPVGGGIVVGSHPEREWLETWEKAEGILRALR
jgi:para-aminobenzoate synthetase component 1